LVRGGRSRVGPSFDRDKLDNLSLGLENFAAGNLHRLPMAIARLATLRRRMLKLVGDYDVLLTPTLADPPPLVGHLDPTADYEQIIDRLVDWVAFTPLQNVTGEPAISLPLGESADGLPIGMMFSARLGRERTLLELAFELEEAAPFRLLRTTSGADSDAQSH
jgi:amidase